jgi:hypothetical protein
MVKVDVDHPREPSHDADANILLRDEDAKYCMRQKGYIFERLRSGG